ncbi:MAG: adenylate kinase [Planctomycetes bacterium]|nr:adenylate kinase [Planctomycetota bacterium]
MNDSTERQGWLQGPHVAREPEPLPYQRAVRFVLLGPPGVGKGTQAERIVREFRACHLSTGDLFRAAKCAEHVSPAMRAAVACMQRGELVSDEIVIDLVRERSSCLRCHGGFLLDGFPRTILQARALDAILQDLGVELDAALAFELPIDEVIERLGGRRTCSGCAAVFHVVSRPPLREGICDHCRSTLFQRDDDREETIRVRMRVYEESTGPLIDYFARAGKLELVSASGDPDMVFERGKSAILGRLALTPQASVVA